LETENSLILKLDFEFTMKMVRKMNQMERNLMAGLQSLMNGSLYTLLKSLSFTPTQKLQATRNQ